MRILLNNPYSFSLFLGVLICHTAIARTGSENIARHIISTCASPPPAVATNLNAFYRHGQVFLTCQKVSNPEAYYRVYRSRSMITSGSQLPECEYLGQVNSTSAKDFNLSSHDGEDNWLVIDSGSSPLSGTTGLFVATTLENGMYFYALTTKLGELEDSFIIPGINSMQNSVTETVDDPQPVFQQSRSIDSRNVMIYSLFLSMKYAVDQPLMNNVGFIANDFAVFLNDATTKRPA